MKNTLSSFRPHRLGLYLVLGFGLIAGGFPLWGVELEAKKDGVEVYESASKKSKVISTLQKDQSLQASERKGMYWMVKTPDGQNGFVSIMGVRKKAGGDNSLSNAIRDAVKEGRQGSEGDSKRARSAVMGVRGLDESDETAFAGNVKPNLKLVYEMEDRQVSKKSLQRHGQMVFKEIEKKSHQKGIQP